MRKYSGQEGNKSDDEADDEMNVIVFLIIISLPTPPGYSMVCLHLGPKWRSR